MSYLLKFSLAGMTVWILSALMFRLGGSQNENFKLAIAWSFIFTIFFSTLGAFRYVYFVDLQRVYAIKEVGFSRNDVLVALSYLIGMFVGFPLSASLFERSESFSVAFAIAVAILFFWIVAWIGRLLIHARKTDQLFMKGGFIDRKSSQKQFWIYCSFLVFMAVVFMGLGFSLLAALVFS